MTVGPGASVESLPNCQSRREGIVRERHGDSVTIGSPFACGGVRGAQRTARHRTSGIQRTGATMEQRAGAPRELQPRHGSRFSSFCFDGPQQALAFGDRCEPQCLAQPKCLGNRHANREPATMGASLLAGPGFACLRRRGELVGNRMRGRGGIGGATDRAVGLLQSSVERGLHGAECSPALASLYVGPNLADKTRECG